MNKLKFLCVVFACMFTVGVACAFTACNIGNPGEPPKKEEPDTSDRPEQPTEPSQPSTPTETIFTPHQSAQGIEMRLTKESEKIVDFSNGSSSDFYWADGYSNGDMFNCTWRKSSAAVENGVMSMSVLKENGGYAGAEYRTDKTYSYGFYSVCMKAADCSGVISSFFTYTNKPVWDEIDIEFLGKDMTRIQFNYYTNGVGGHEFYFELGFDASKDFHEYSFDWQPDSIVWYVDGVAVYKATENLPSHSMQIMANVWNCKGAEEWSGAFDAAALPATAQYKWLAYSPNT